jgi:hypothetical protein
MVNLPLCRVNEGLVSYENCVLCRQSIYYNSDQAFKNIFGTQNLCSLVHKVVNLHVPTRNQTKMYETMDAMQAVATTACKACKDSSDLKCTFPCSVMRQN